MTKIKYVGRPSLDFFGKYLSEIAKNLSNQGVGRVVVKESEERFHKEPSYYVIKSIEPLMSDSVKHNFNMSHHLFSINECLFLYLSQE